MPRAATTAGAVALAGVLWRRYTTPFPYAQRWLLDRELPGLSREALLGMLEPRAGERILEVGPGTGLFTLAVAERLGPGGELAVVDVQQEMVEHTLMRAREQGLANVTGRRADAMALPHAAGSFDGAYAMTVLGEIHHQSTALGELRRVLRPGGRVVVGEFMIDWHAVPLPLLRRRARRAGLTVERWGGTPIAYLARLRADAAAGRPERPTTGAG